MPVSITTAIVESLPIVISHAFGRLSVSGAYILGYCGSSGVALAKTA
jgi:hypothetical protein